MHKTCCERTCARGAKIGTRHNSTPTKHIQNASASLHTSLHRLPAWHLQTFQIRNATPLVDEKHAQTKLQSVPCNAVTDVPRVRAPLTVCRTGAPRDHRVVRNHKGAVVSTTEAANGPTCVAGKGGTQSLQKNSFSRIRTVRKQVRSASVPPCKRLSSFSRNWLDGPPDNFMRRDEYAANTATRMTTRRRCNCQRNVPKVKTLYTQSLTVRRYNARTCVLAFYRHHHGPYARAFLHTQRRLWGPTPLCRRVVTDVNSLSSGNCSCCKCATRQGTPTPRASRLVRKANCPNKQEASACSGHSRPSLLIRVGTEHVMQSPYIRKLCTTMVLDSDSVRALLACFAWNLWSRKSALRP